MKQEECVERVFNDLHYEPVRLAAPEADSTERPDSPRSDAEQARRWGLKVGDVVGTCHHGFDRSILTAMTIRYIGDQAVVCDRRKWSVPCLTQAQPTRLTLPFEGKEERTVTGFRGSAWWLLKPKGDRSVAGNGAEGAESDGPPEKDGSKDGWVTGFRKTIFGFQPKIVSGSLILSMSACRLQTTAWYRRYSSIDEHFTTSYLLSAEHHSCFDSAHARYQQLLEKAKEKP